jgi:hypothetical protein
MHGISQNSITNDYIMVLQYVEGEQCEKCGKKYTNTAYKWCKQCQTNLLKVNFINWTSNNEQIDNFIQELRSMLRYRVFEWIPYDQFNNIKKIKELSKDNFSVTHSAIWKDGPLQYDFFKRKKWARESNKKVTLKCTNNSQDLTRFLIKVLLFYL